MKYDVFISYRRSSFESANLIAEKMRSMGYSVFFDVETLRAGDFNEQLFDVIDECKDFILVLPPNALDKCNNEEDWVRKEVLRALASNKNIIPVLLSGFSWPNPMPKDMEELNKLQAITAGTQEFFDMSMKRLASYLTSKRHRNLRNFYKKIGIAVAAIILLSSLGIFGLHQTAKPLCKNIVSNITCGVSNLNILCSDAKSFANRWETFINDYKAAKTKSQKDEVISRHTTYIEKTNQDVNFRYSQFTRLPELSSHQVSLLGLYDIESQEISAFYGIFDALYYDIQCQLNFIKETMSNEEALLDSSLTNHYGNYIALSAESFQANLDMIFYAYLELMSKFPKYSHEQYSLQCPEWINLPPSPGLTLSINEYRTLQDAAYKRASEIIEEMEKDLAKLRGEVEGIKQLQ